MGKTYCYKCNKLLGISNFKLFAERFVGWVDNGRNGQKKIFCDDQCYNEYLKEHFVEKYKNADIYRVTRNGIECYVPYMGCYYWFEDIENCRRRIDNCTVGVY